jgi:hypothetical protein
MDPTPKWMKPYNEGRPAWLNVADTYYIQKKKADVVPIIPTPPKTPRQNTVSPSPRAAKRINKSPSPPPAAAAKFKNAKKSRKSKKSNKSKKPKKSKKRSTTRRHAKRV